MDDHKTFFTNFTTRRSIFWFSSLAPAMALLTFYPFGREYDWIWVLSFPLILTLAIGEFVRFRIRRNSARRSEAGPGKD